MIGIGSLPSTDNLLCFLAAVEHAGFRHAARAVALTPTAFGERIQWLEEHLGVQLFERTTRRVTLTAAGAALVPVAREAIAHVRRCVDAARIGAPARAEFVLGTRFELGVSWLVPTLGELARSRPEWTIHLYFGAGPDVLTRLQLGEIDAAITSAPFARADFRGHVLHPESYVLCAAPPLLVRTPLDRPEDAALHTLLDIDRSMPLARYLVTSPGDAVAFGAVRYLGTGAAIHALALAGLGVAVLPGYMVEADLGAGRLVRLLPERPLLSDTFRLLHRHDSAHASALAELAIELQARQLR